MTGRGAVCELELAQPILNLVLPTPASFVQLLVRHEGRPIGWVRLSSAGDAQIDSERLRNAISYELGWRLAATVLVPHKEPLEAPSLGPPISVVVCTRDRTAELEGCLESLVALDYPAFEVLVVDNASKGRETEALAARFGVRYIGEQRPGLDWARNRGIREARHPIIAFTDDDARVDPLWLAGIAEAFEDPSVDVVTGLIAPLELETEAQQLFEFAYGGMGKGFTPFYADQAILRPQQLVRVPSLGVGANMAFRRRVFASVGDFDPALDVGTAAHGGGDLDMFHRALAGGHMLLYAPSALVWHRHRRSLDELEGQLGDDGRVFAIYLMKVFRSRTVARRHVVSFALRRWIPWLGARLVRGLLGRERLPLRLLWAPVKGMLYAPFAGRQARRSAARLASYEPNTSL
jgi:glycosyltransferase involved in cell wall biosynthesis